MNIIGDDGNEFFHRFCILHKEHNKADLRKKLKILRMAAREELWKKKVFFSLSTASSIEFLMLSFLHILAVSTE
jgi:hypothetical protein